METFTGETSDYIWPFVKAHIQEYISKNPSAVAAYEYQFPNTTNETVTHTGQIFSKDDYRRSRFEGVTGKIVNKNFAIDLVNEEPIVVTDQRVVWSSGGGPLGHPKVYINLDPPEVHVCGYSGRRFIKKKYYDEKKHGKSITYDQYLEEMAQKEAVEL